MKEERKNSCMQLLWLSAWRDGTEHNEPGEQLFPNKVATKPTNKMA